jgi:CubicO group peptidase (beta-lactamase class C family)
MSVQFTQRRSEQEWELDTKVAEMLNRRPTVGLAVGIVRDGCLEFSYGHGLADIAPNTPISEDSVFRIGSLTKTFTAIGVMQLWEQGLLDLDAAANDYLSAYGLIPAHPTRRPATVRHLLTHTAGLPQCAYLSRAFRPVLGEMVKFGRPVPTLVHYGGGLRLVAGSGMRHVYSNHGFATLGQIVEDVTGQPLQRYFREHIFEPLGMVLTDLVRSDRIHSSRRRRYGATSVAATRCGDRGEMWRSGRSPRRRSSFEAVRSCFIRRLRYEGCAGSSCIPTTKATRACSVSIEAFAVGTAVAAARRHAKRSAERSTSSWLPSPSCGVGIITRVDPR